MARPLSQDKRNAILDAATQVVAASGTSAPTAKIAKLAGVAEGTLFTYFPNKEDLLNQLYIQLKTDLRDALMTGYPADEPLIDRARFTWERYIQAGVKGSQKRKALSQLGVSDLITDKTRKAASNYFITIRDMFHQCAARGALKNLPSAFVLALMNAIADTTIAFIEKEPARARQHTKVGFDAFWRAVQ